MIIYIVSVVEAIGLSVYFNARISDPEMASMEPPPMDMQDTTAEAATQPGCAHCSMVAGAPQHVLTGHGYVPQVGSARQRERR